MRGSRVRKWWAALAIGPLLAVAACKSDSGEQCKRDSDCGAGRACGDGTCLPRLNADQTWAVELVPKNESLWMPSESPSVLFSSDPVTLRVEPEEVVKGTVQPLDPDGTVKAVLQVSSAIGLADRTFGAQTSGRNPDGPGSFMIRVPRSALGRPASVRIVPASPLDRVLPTWTTPVAPLVSPLVISVPTDFSTAQGVLQNAAGDQVIAGYGVRALVGERQVSNADRTTVQGRFTLRIPKSVKLDEVRVELSPMGESTALPTLVATITNDKLNLGMLRLPPAGKSQLVQVPVTSMTTGKKLASVTLVFYAPLPGALGAEASLRRELQTDKDGVASGQLLVGGGGETLTYAVAAIPPADSEYGSRCVTGYQIVASSGARMAPTIELPAKAALTGTVMDALGVPQRGVIITAFRQDPTYVKDCATDIASPEPMVTTGMNGTFRLLLDPGTYRLQYEPTVASASPLLLQDGVVVSESAVHDVTLPPGVLAEGVVRTATSDDMPAVGCEVRLYGPPSAMGKLPDLRGRARTGADGRFRIVLPQAP